MKEQAEPSPAAAEPATAGTPDAGDMATPESPRVDARPATASPGVGRGDRAGLVGTWFGELTSDTRKVYYYKVVITGSREGLRLGVDCSSKSDFSVSTALAATPEVKLDLVPHPGSDWVIAVHPNRSPQWESDSFYFVRLDGDALHMRLLYKYGNEGRESREGKLKRLPAG